MQKYEIIGIKVKIIEEQVLESQYALDKYCISTPIQRRIAIAKSINLQKRLILNSRRSKETLWIGKSKMTLRES
jgi:hypothetical protein